MISVHNTKDNTTKAFPLKTGCNIVINFNNLTIYFNKDEKILMVRDNQSEKGTFKKEKSGRMNLNPKTLYEFELKADNEDAMIFQIGSYILEFKDHALNLLNESDNEESEEEVEKPKLLHTMNKQQNMKKVELPFDLDAATQILDQNNHHNNNDKLDFDATVVLDQGNLFAMPHAQKQNQFQVPFGKPAAKRQVPSFLDGPIQMLNDNFGGKPNNNNASKLMINQFDPTLVFNNNQKPNPQPDLYGETQVLNQNNHFMQPVRQREEIKHDKNLDLGATLIINPNKKQYMADDIDATLILSNGVHKVKDIKMKIYDSEESSEDLQSSPQFAMTKKRAITDSMEDIIDQLDGNKEEKKQEEKQNQLSKILEESSEEEEKVKPAPIKAQKFTQEKQKIVKSAKVEEKRNDEINYSIDDILEERQEEKPQAAQSQRYNKRKANQISDSNQQDKKDEILSQQVVKRRKIDDNSKKVAVKKNARGKSKVQDEDEEAEDNEVLTILVTGDAKEAQFQKVRYTLMLIASQIIKNLKGTAVTEIDKEFDVMVTGKLLRNAKLLYAINIGARVVGLQWLKDSQSKGKFQETDKYLLYDKEFEKTYHCNLKNLYTKMKSGIMSDHSVFVSKNIQGVSKETVDSLVTSAGGVVEESSADATVQILDEVKDKKSIAQLKAKKTKSHICSVELIFEGILTQKLDFKKHTLIK